MDEQRKRFLELAVYSGQATEAEMEELGADNVLALKSVGDDIHYRDFAEAEEVKELGDREYEFVFSSQKADRIGDVLESRGWVLDDYKTNPVVLWAHDGKSHPPIGTASKVRKNVPHNGSKALVGNIKFAPEGISPLIDTVAGLVQANVLKATSVGLQFLEIKEVNDPKKRDSLGLGKFGVYSLKHRLKEQSIVSVGMHQEALRKGCDDLLTAGSASKEGVKAFLETTPNPEEAIREMCGSMKFQIPFAFKELEIVDEEPQGDLFAEPTIEIGNDTITTTGNDFVPFSIKTIDFSSVNAELQERITKLEEQLKLAAEANIRQAEAIEAMADAFASLSTGVDAGSAKGASESDARNAVADALSDLTEKASQRVASAMRS
jgi:hypothetical protein